MKLRLLLNLACVLMAQLPVAAGAQGHAPTNLFAVAHPSGDVTFYFDDANVDEWGFNLYVYNRSGVYDGRIGPVSGSSGEWTSWLNFKQRWRIQAWITARGPWGESPRSKPIYIFRPGGIENQNFAQRFKERCRTGTREVCFGEDNRYHLWVSARRIARYEPSGRPVYEDGLVNWRKFEDAPPSAFGWLYGRDNIELTVKLLDGCHINGNMWLYAAATTDQSLSFSLTDLESGTEKSYNLDAGDPDGGYTGWATRFWPGYGLQDQAAMKCVP